MSAQPKQKSTMQNLAKSLKIGETELLIAIKQLGLNPSEVEESWGDAIAQHLTGIKPQSLKGTKPESTPESFSIEDSDEYIRQQRDNAQALADAGNIEFAKTLLQGQIEGINQVVGLQNLLAEDFQNLIHQRIEELGKRGKERPNELIKDLGKKATTNQQSSQKTTTVRHKTLDLVGLKSKASNSK
ncbi:MAG: hypothetical protein U1V55_22305 [Planktothrix rubescens PR222]